VVAYYTEQLDPPLSTPFRVSWIESFQVWVTFASALISGSALDRIPAQILTTTGTLAFVLSCMLMSISTYWSMFLSQALLQGIAVGTLFPPALTCTAHWFSRNRGLALGIVASGSSLGGVLWPIILDRLIHNRGPGGVGFGWALRISGFIALAALVPTIPFVRKRIAAVQRGPFVDTRSFHNRAFLLLLIGQFIIYLGFYSEYYYLPQMAATLSMPSHLIFYLSSAGNGVSALGRVFGSSQTAIWAASTSSSSPSQPRASSSSASSPSCPYAAAPPRPRCLGCRRRTGS